MKRTVHRGLTTIMAAAALVAGCGGSVGNLDHSARMALDPESSEFRKLMELYPSEVAESGGDIYTFMAHFGEPGHRTSEHLHAAAATIFPTLGELPNSEEFAGVLLLVQGDGHGDARNWFNNYDSNPAVTSNLALILRNAKSIAVKGWLYATRSESGVDDSDELAHRLTEYALEELVEREMPLTADARKSIVEAGLLRQEPAVLAHLKAGLPAAGEPLTEAGTRSLTDPDPEIFDAVLLQAGGARSWTSLQNLGSVANDVIPQAAGVYPLMIARYFEKETGPPEALDEFARISEEDPSVLEVARTWLDAHPEISYRNDWDALVSYADPAAGPGQEPFIDWLKAEAVEAFGKSRMAISTEDYLVSGGGEEGNETLEKLDAILAHVDSTIGEPISRSVVHTRPITELDELVYEYVVLRQLARNAPVIASKILSAKLNSTEGDEIPAHVAATRVAAEAGTDEWRGAYLLDETLRVSMLRLVEQEYDPDIAAIFLTLLASPQDDLRGPALQHAQTYFDRDTFVAGLFGFMVRKGQFGLAELARYEDALKGFDGVEAPLVRQLNAAVDAAGQPENVYWALKVLSLDVLEDIGTAAATPVLQRLAEDTGSYSYRQTEMDPTTLELRVVSEETIAFADRVEALLEKTAN